MEPREIMSQLERYTGKLPREALEAAIADPEAITPDLLQVLEYTVRNAERVAMTMAIWHTRMPCFCSRNSGKHVPIR